MIPEFRPTVVDKWLADGWTKVYIYQQVEPPEVEASPQGSEEPIPLFTELLDRYMEAKAEMDHAREDKCHDWSYFHAREIEEYDAAAKALNDRLAVLTAERRLG